MGFVTIIAFAGMYGLVAAAAIYVFRLGSDRGRHATVVTSSKLPPKSILGRSGVRRRAKDDRC